ncbi:MAG TPA: hypothetical protein DHW14_02180 [Clostridiales bacterium]|nr:hypothetical protein [Clostridiales bacterium]
MCPDGVETTRRKGSVAVSYAPGLRLLPPVLAAALILGLVAAVYRPLVSAEPGVDFPWGRDTWGHLFKAHYLYDQAAGGDPFPDLMPWWCAGSEPFRHQPPLPYYLLAGLRHISGDIFTAGARLVPLCALFGSLSWLAFAGRLGWVGACAAGLGWAVWPDHIRVALSEGDLPQVVATALLPLLFAAFLDSLDRRRWPWSGFATVVLLSLLVLTDVTVAALSCAALAFFSLFYRWFSGARGRDMVRGLSLILLALLVSAWWLVPSLAAETAAVTGAVDPEAAGRAPDFLPPSVSFDPLSRLQSPEVFYLGLSSIVLLAAALAGWRGKDPAAKAFFVCGVLTMTVAATFPPARPCPSFLSLLPASLPGGQVLRPPDFACLLPVAVFIAALPRAQPARGGRGWFGTLLPALLVAALVLVDAAGSFHLVHTREQRPDLAAAARTLADARGWRVAVLDMGRLGSEPSFVLSRSADREQVFGSGWQGACVRGELGLINTALEHGRYAYAADRSLQFGATDLLVPRDWAGASRLAAAARAAGYSGPETHGGLLVFRRPLPPFALRHSYEVLAVGRRAGEVALLFPGVESGTSPEIDGYELSDLEAYRTVFLTGASWRSKRRAEELVLAYVRGGGRVVIDLTDFPTGILDEGPSFLGVTGEAVEIRHTVSATGPSASEAVTFRSFNTLHDPWEAFVPQGLDRTLLSFRHSGRQAVVVGEKDLEGGTVVFVGLNLPYHALLTDDPAALTVLSDLLDLEPDAPPARETTPLQAYRATADGYSFTFEVPEAWGECRVILPVAFHDTVAVRVDGRPVEVRPVEHLVAVRAGPGLHKLQIEAAGPPLAGVSAVVSAVTLLLLTAYVCVTVRRAPTRAPGARRST